MRRPADTFAPNDEVVIRKTGRTAYIASIARIHGLTRYVIRGYNYSFRAEDLDRPKPFREFHGSTTRGLP